MILLFKRLRWGKIVSGFIFLTLSLSAIYVTVMIFIAPSWNQAHVSEERLKSDYVLMLLECILGIFAMMLPGLLESRIKLVIPSKMIILYAVFLYCAIYLGEIRSFYYSIPYWDIIMHFFSGCILGTLGFSFIVLLNNTDRIPVNLSPLFISVFTFCFAVTLGAIWEIYEFSVDGLLGLNMQKFALENGTLLTGHAALTDTMEDIIVDCISAFAISLTGYLSFKYKKGWVERHLLRIHRENAPETRSL